jgi:hypothetical protein
MSVRERRVDPVEQRSFCARLLALVHSGRLPAQVIPHHAAALDPLLVHFPELDREYRSNEIFPIFANRVMSPRRSDFGSFLERLDLGPDATPFEILARSAGSRATDSDSAR